MKTYNLEIQELREFEGGHLGWWSKGHQDKIAFLFAVTEDMDERFEATSEQVRHEHWRCVPVGSSGDATRGSLLVKAKEGTRGSFPVTAIED